MKQYVVPMTESERGWGSKLDGYAGPFASKEDAERWAQAYNRKYNNKSKVPDWYIRADSPVPYTKQKCNYRVELS